MKKDMVFSVNVEIIHRGLYATQILNVVQMFQNFVFAVPYFLF